MKRTVMLALVPLLVACSGAPAATPSLTPDAVAVARGAVDVHATLALANVGDPCVTRGGYTDIGAGTQVKILDDAGKVLAFGQLGGGKVTELKRCKFPFQVVDVPTGRKIYGVEVSHRGVVQVNEADLGRIELRVS